MERNNFEAPYLKTSQNAERTLSFQGGDFHLVFSLMFHLMFIFYFS